MKMTNPWWDELANLPFPESYPAGHGEVLLDELTFQRAVQVYIWALPAMNMYSVQRHMETTAAGAGEVMSDERRVSRDEGNHSKLNPRHCV